MRWLETPAGSGAAFAQPLDDLPSEGDLVTISIWHDSLDAAEPATGHVAVLLDDRVLWEQTVDIPAPSAALDAEVLLDFAPSPDAQLGLHLHNHGYNSWRFVAVQVTSP